MTATLPPRQGADGYCDTYAPVRSAMVTSAPHILIRAERPTPTKVFEAYWQFAARRQDVFFRRLEGQPPPWTEDAVLLRFRFTNAYRVLDRVSQFLVGEVAYSGSQDAQEVFFRTILFKLFNKIETWQLLSDHVGSPTLHGFCFEAYDRVLSDALDSGTAIYSGAYIMPSAGHWGESRKHRNHLRLLEAMINTGAPERVSEASSMAEAFQVLRSFQSIGDFLAYQLVTDLNYTTLCDFDEMEFVVPGPGARSGLAKCFSSLGGFSEADTIRWVAEEQREQFASRGINFRDLWGRPLQLIDCQNLFCEVDKYARVAHPEVTSSAGRTRIKQRFQSSGSVLAPTLPPKWGVHPQSVVGTG